MIYQFHIRITGVYSPDVWRRVTVPAGFSFHKFHKVIQKSFGWKNYHLFKFLDAGRTLIDFEQTTNSFDIGHFDPEDDIPEIDAKTIKLHEIFNLHKKINYIYDFGDHWTHEITLEKTEESDSKNAFLLGGEGACPPEDCGGVFGYNQFKLVMADPTHDEYHNFRMWAGLKKKQLWDPALFDPKHFPIGMLRV
jgi:hypothetical protein